MAAPTAAPTNFVVQTANAQNYLSWDIGPSTVTQYNINRSTNGLNYAVVATITGPTFAYNYLDTDVTPGYQYFYYVQPANTDGVGPATGIQSVCPAISGELSLASIRLQAQQRADRVNSTFVGTAEWNTYINQALFELYDLLIDNYEDYFVATPYSFVSDGTTFLYPVPNGTNTYTNGITGASGYIAPPFYKLLGVDLGLQTAQNAFVTLNKFNFIDRNRFVYPNTASTIYGVFNLQYRLLGNNIEFIPTPSAGQVIRVWYIPRLTQLLKDTDTTTAGISGWIEYVIVKAAYYALNKEESDTSQLVLQLQALTKRIEESAMNRDAGQPDRISDVRQNYGWGSYGNMWNGGSGPIGGF